MKETLKISLFCNFNWFVNRKTVISSWWWKYELPSHTGLSLSCSLACIENILIKNCGEWREGKMKSSATNVQVDVTFYKKTFNSRFSLAEWVSDAVAAKESSLQKKRCELKCVAMWHYYWQYYYHHQLNSQCAFRIVSLRLLVLALLSLYAFDDAGWWRKSSLYGTHKCCHQFFFRDALHVIIYHF
mgnify:FL=1